MLLKCFDAKCEFRQIGFYRVAGILLIVLCVLSANAAPPASESKPFELLMPRPQFIKIGKDVISIPVRQDQCLDTRSNVSLEEYPIAGAMRVLRHRFTVLAQPPLASQAFVPMQIVKSDVDSLRNRIKLHTEELSDSQLAQAYWLHVDREGDGLVRIEAASETGISYALLTLAQLMERDTEGNVIIPAVEILDWPNVAFRLFKLSGVFSPTNVLCRDIHLAAMLKMNYFGLQYHQGKSKKEPHEKHKIHRWDIYSSKNPQPPFRKNVERICALTAQSKLINTIVYFCPFRGQTDYFHLDNSHDREAFVQFLLWCMEQGAKGIEIDYNDWVGRSHWRGRGAELPYEDIINSVYEGVRASYPQAHILWCPPHPHGDVPFGYMGPINERYKAVLAKIPSDVKVIWTGPTTAMARIESPLSAGDFAAWSTAAQRKPLLWINGGFKWFAKEVAIENESVKVFYGERLPTDLDQLVCGTHFNFGAGLTRDTQLYFATAADFVWNPDGWDEAGSCRRARRFLEILAGAKLWDLPESQAHESNAFVLSECIEAESHLPAYLNQNKAILAFQRTELAPKNIKLEINVLEKTTGCIPCQPIQLEIPAGSVRKDLPIDISNWPDGEYRVVIKEIRGDHKDTGQLIRAIRKQTIPESPAPEEPIDVNGITTLFVDDWYIQKKEGLSRCVHPAETIALTNEVSAKKYPHNITSLRDFSFDGKGGLTVTVAAKNDRGESPIVYSMRSEDLENWEFIDNSLLKKEDTAIQNKLQGHDGCNDVKFRYYDKQKDGNVPLSEIEVRYSGLKKNVKWGDIAIPSRCRIPIWVKSSHENIILGHEPITKDKWAFDENEIGDWEDSNDNFGGQILSRDGKTLRCYQGRLIPRNAPFRVNYDNIYASRILLTWSTEDGFNWKPTYFSAPDFNDPIQLQHYGVQVFWQEGKRLQLGYLKMYDQVMQRVYTELVYSRDEIRWHRFEGRPKFVDNGKFGSWNFGYSLVGKKKVEKGDSVFQAMVGINVLHFMYLPAFRDSEMTSEWLKNTWLQGRLSGGKGIEHSPAWQFYGSWEKILEHIHYAKVTPGLMKYRKQGWVSLKAGQQEGWFVSKALHAGDELSINAFTQENGYITIEVLDSEGTEWVDYCGENAAGFTGDSTDRQLLWKQSSVGKIPKSPIRLRITMKNADLYALTWR